MRYMGGKQRIGQALADIIMRQTPRHYAEPLCGMFSVGKHITGAVRFASDIHPDLILLLQAVQDGWDPPSVITEEEYDALKQAPPSALRGFVGFGCSFAGKFFGGYAREGKRDFCANARNNLLKLRPHIQDVTFQNQTYLAYAPATPLPTDVIYCDPPYAGTTGFTVGDFQINVFWDWVRNRDELVFVSEYAAPDDFQVVWEKAVKTDMKGKSGKGLDRVERLFIHESRTFDLHF